MVDAFARESRLLGIEQAVVSMTFPPTVKVPTKGPDPPDGSGRNLGTAPGVVGTGRRHQGDQYLHSRLGRTFPAASAFGLIGPLFLLIKGWKTCEEVLTGPARPLLAQTVMVGSIGATTVLV
ncbi:hypothetical protein [Acidithrix sp. C25]|uniref:hypothetical protein n=1 Tax=Acidithrix sp. C25 TaxID=1671482 RepID=UPI001BCB7F0F|nr:hypothetical protein [Acidithrix sp. C25]